MKRFSERYGFVKPSTVLIRGELTEEIQNAICTVYDTLRQMSPQFNLYDLYQKMEEYLWCCFLNQRRANFYSGRGYRIVATNYIENKRIPWYNKLDLIEETVNYLSRMIHEENGYDRVYTFFVKKMNAEFARLNFAYRIVDDKIVEVTSEEEIDTIESAMRNSSNGVKEHLQTALKLLSKRPEGDYRNSIKESISAVEVVVREITGETTLKISHLENAGIVLPLVLKKSFELLYGYTNDKSTGIRHALMDDTNKPTVDEATFMLIACSAFVNYLAKKQTELCRFVRN
jgi:hypothetical protein